MARFSGKYKCFGRAKESHQSRTSVALFGITALAAGGDFALALKNDGTVWAWGQNSYGQLGNNTMSGSLTPVQVVNSTNTGFLTGIIAVVGSYAESIALRNDGTVWTWSYNADGELGMEKTPVPSRPFRSSLPPATPLPISSGRTRPPGKSAIGR